MQILVPNALFMLSRRAATFTDATPYRHGEAANIAIASLAAAACSGAAHADDNRDNIAGVDELRCSRSGSR